MRIFSLCEMELQGARRQLPGLGDPQAQRGRGGECGPEQPEKGFKALKRFRCECGTQAPQVLELISALHAIAI